MPRLTPATAAAIAELRQASSDDTRILLIRTIGDSGEPAALASLLPDLIAESPRLALTARRAAQALLAALPVSRLGWLEQAVRAATRFDVYYRGVGGLGGGSWRRLAPQALASLAATEGGQTLLALASFHDSGYVREAAVRLLGDQPDAAALPFLLVRANDWVAEVRETARQAIRKQLVPARAAALLDNISLCQRLLEQRRTDAAALYGQIEALLLTDAARGVREEGERSPDRQVRRAAFQLSAKAATGPALRPILRRGLDCPDLWVRIWAARTARSALYGPALRETLGQARGDRSVPVRREALLGFVEEFPELRDSLLDPCASLREMVRFYLRKKANLDFAAIYRAEAERLAAEPPGPGVATALATALAGLGETGRPDDADFVELFAIDGRPRVEQAALAALARLGGERSLPTLGAALLSPSPRVVRTVVEALGGRLAGLPRWTAIRHLVLACADTDATVAAAAEQEVRRWLAAPDYTRPTSTELDAARDLLPRARALLGDPRLVAELGRIILTWANR